MNTLTFRALAVVFTTLIASSAFADRESDGRGCLDSIYQDELGRGPDYPGAQGWLDAYINGTSCSSLRSTIRTYPEAIAHRERQNPPSAPQDPANGPATPSGPSESDIRACLSRIYIDELGHDLDGGAGGWLDQLRAGMSCADMRNQIRNHPDAIAFRNSRNGGDGGAPAPGGGTRPNGLTADQARACVTKHYQQYLGRDPDYPGANGWLDLLTSGQNTCPQVGDAISRSEEAVAFRSRGNTPTPATPSNPTPPSNSGPDELRARLLRDARECVANAYREFLERDVDAGSEGFVNAIVRGEYDCLEARARIRYSPEGNAVAKRKENEQNEANFQVRNSNSVECVNRAIMEVFGEARQIGSFGAIVNDINFNRTRCGAETTRRVQLTPEGIAFGIQQARAEQEREFQARNQNSVDCVNRAILQVFGEQVQISSFGAIVNDINFGRTSCDGAVGRVYNTAEARDKRQRDAQVAAENARQQRTNDALACVSKAENEILGHSLPSSVAQNLVNLFVRGTYSCPTIRAVVTQIAENERNPPSNNPDPGSPGINSFSASSARGGTRTTTARPATSGGARTITSSSSRPSGGGGRLSIQSAGAKKTVVKATAKKKK
ncbi:MAG: DUF4214 domain-containing protein [Bdellovibrionia bacterium]